MRVFLLRIVAAKNSRNRFAARSPASPMIAGTTIDAATLAEIRVGFSAGTTVSCRPVLDSVSRCPLAWVSVT